MSPPPRGDMFHCPPLHAWQRDELIVKAKEACKFLVVNATTSEFNPVESVVQNARTGRHATVRRLNDKTDPQYEGFSAHTKVRASINEVAGFFELDTPHKAQAYARVMGEIVLDKRTLYTLVERPIADGASQPLHYVSVEWLMVKMPFGFNTRDVCYLECHDEFSFHDQTTGELRRGWARCTHSINLVCCPNLQRSHNVVRMDIVRSGHVFLESSDAGVLDYYRVAVGSANGTMIKHVAKTLVDRHLKHMTSMALNLEEYFISQRIRPMLDVPVGHFQSKNAVQYCMHCYNRFAWHATKRQCRGCGDVTCAKCSCVWNLPLAHKKTIKVQLCHECITGDMTSAKRRPHARSGAVSPRQSMYSTCDDDRTTFAHSSYRPSMSEQPSMVVSTLFAPTRKVASRTPSAFAESDAASVCSSVARSSTTSFNLDSATELHVLSPSQWRVSEDVNTSIRDGMLTFHSDSTAVYLHR